MGGLNLKSSNIVVCVGEILIDFFCTDFDIDLKLGTHFVKQAGGAPANVSIAISKLGGRALFAGKVGDDPFGHYLKETLQGFQVDTSMLSHDPNSSTTLAFVSLKSDGERDFTFHQGADLLLTVDELDINRMMQAKIIHFGSATSMLGGPAFTTYFKVMALARENGIFVSFDPNFREFLWRGRREEFRERALKAISIADFVKVSEDELKLISGTEDINHGVNILHQYGSKMIVVTLGKQGSLISNGDQSKIVSSIRVNTVDTTGAGDAFVGATLFQLSQKEFPGKVIYDFEEFKRIAAFSNKAAALVCTRIGAITALPSYDEVENF